MSDSAGIPSTRFTVEDLPEQDRYAIWKESISCIFEVDTDRQTRSENFRAEVQAHMIGGLMLANAATLQHSWSRKTSTIAADGMDHFMIQLFDKGSVGFEHKGETKTLPNGGLVVLDLAQEARTVTNDFANLSLIIPRDRIEPNLTPGADHHLRILTQDEPLVQLLYEHMQSLQAVASRMNQAEARQITPFTLGLAAACLNGTTQGAPEISVGVVAADILAARRYINKNLANPELCPEEIASHIGIARSKLYLMFEPSGGVMRHVRQKRLRRVADWLRRPETRGLPIQEIALRNGFANNSSFSRAFRLEYDCTPREYRQRAATGAIWDEPSNASESVYGHWLHSL